MTFNYTQLHSITLNYIQLNRITLIIDAWGGATLTGPTPKTALFLEIRKPQKTILIPYFCGSGVKL